MKIIMYGTDTCVDCVAAMEELNKTDIKCLYLKFEDGIGNLKRFLKIRDTEAMFNAVRENGGVGVPLFVFEDGTMTLSLDDVLNAYEAHK